MRITMSDLKAVVARINRITNSPLEPWTRENGKSVANIGCYHLSGAYGGWCLHRMDNVGGGVSCPINSDYVSKRELYNLIHAFIRGLEG
jgi:hypothetical protein